MGCQWNLFTTSWILSSRLFTEGIDMESYNSYINQNKFIVDYLRDDGISKKIESNNLTLAMIRPNVGESVNFISETDEYASDRLIENIQYLGIYAKISVELDEAAVEEFYADVADQQRLMPPEYIHGMDNRWSEFKHLMTTGTSEFLLLESNDNNAVKSWRSQIGHWNIEKSRDTSTLRGRFGIHNHNNLFHGSDSPESAQNELNIVTECLERSIGGASLKSILHSIG